MIVQPFRLALACVLLGATARGQSDFAARVPELTRAAERVAARVLQQNQTERTYRADLALEGIPKRVMS